MTEGEAKTKYCPIMHWAPHDLPTNPNMHCVGSACMMWRWYSDIEMIDILPRGTNLQMVTRHGSCGLRLR